MTPPIEQFLTQFRDDTVHYIPNPGNAGDSVIAAATYQAFARVGLNYEIPNPFRVSLKDKVVIYGGGGNLIGTTTYSHRVISSLHRHASRLVILPQTIKSNDALLNSFGDNVDVICRERISYEYATQAAPRARVHLMDDMAINLDPAAIPEISQLQNPYLRKLNFAFRKMFTKRNVPMYSNVVRATHLCQTISQHSHLFQDAQLWCLRTDTERTNIEIPKNNVDLSEIFQFGVEDRDCAYRATRAVIDFLSRFKTVNTNRLHMAITSALLGLDVNFYPNSYYKCREVYNYSLRDRFKNVKWID